MLFEDATQGLDGGVVIDEKPTRRRHQHHLHLATSSSHDKAAPGAAINVPPRSLLVHLVAFTWFAFVWLWHLTPAAAQLPGNFGFGWFFRFLTFYSFSLQTLQLGMACVDDLQRTRRGTSAWTRPTDDLACAIFALTHVVSIMFYTIQGTTKLAVEGGHVQRPPWLDVSVHAFNTLVAWADLLTSDRRSFSRTSECLSTLLVGGYLGYLMLCRRINGRFPYPILNALSYPWGFSGLIAAGLVLFVAAFRAGKLLNKRLRHVSLSIRITQREVVRDEAGAGSSSSSSSSSGGGSVDAGVVVSGGGSAVVVADSSSSGRSTSSPRSYLSLAFIKRRRDSAQQPPQHPVLC